MGIHERSSREKISHVMNGAAHIMNDEATRKYLQAVKRLLTFVQRAYPTDPSRCIDFDGFRNPSRGAAGGGSDKLVRHCDSLLLHANGAAVLLSRCAPLDFCIVQVVSRYSGHPSRSRSQEEYQTPSVKLLRAGDA